VRVLLLAAALALTGVPAYADDAPTVPSLHQVVRVDPDLAGGHVEVSDGPESWAAGGIGCGPSHDLPDPVAATSAEYHPRPARRREAEDDVTVLRLASAKDARHAMAVLHRSITHCQGHRTVAPGFTVTSSDVSGQLRGLGRQVVGYRHAETEHLPKRVVHADLVVVHVRVGDTIVQALVARTSPPSLGLVSRLTRLAVKVAG
jgi:hypothetical protein